MEERGNSRSAGAAKLMGQVHLERSCGQWQNLQPAGEKLPGPSFPIAAPSRGFSSTVTTDGERTSNESGSDTGTPVSHSGNIPFHALAGGNNSGSTTMDSAEEHAWRGISDDDMEHGCSVEDDMKDDHDDMDNNSDRFLAKDHGDSSVQSKLCPRGHWRPAEDDKLRELVSQYGPQNWNLIAEKLQGRSGTVLFSLRGFS